MTIEAIMFPHRCRLLAATESVNDAGQLTRSYTTRATNVECHFQPAGTREIAGRFVARVERARLWLPIGTEFAMSDRVDSIDAAPDGVYEIARSATWYGDHIEIELEAIG